MPICINIVQPRYSQPSYTACCIQSHLSELIHIWTGEKCSSSFNRLTESSFNISIIDNDSGTLDFFRTQSAPHFLLNITNAHTTELYTSYLELLKSSEPLDVNEFSLARYQNLPPPPHLPLTSLAPSKIIDASNRSRNISFIGKPKPKQFEILKSIASHGISLDLIDDTVEADEINAAIRKTAAVILLPNDKLNEIDTCLAFACLKQHTPVITLAQPDQRQTNTIIKECILQIPLENISSLLRILKRQDMINAALSPKIQLWQQLSREVDYTPFLEHLSESISNNVGRFL